MEQNNETPTAAYAVPADESAWATVCELIGKDKASRFCRAFVRNGKLRISSRKFFMFAEVIGAVAAKRIVDMFDGELVALPSLPGLKDTSARDAAICRAKGKVAQKELAKIAEMTERQVRRIQNERKRI